MYPLDMGGFCASTDAPLLILFSELRYLCLDGELEVRCLGHDEGKGKAFENG
jgi:hypothetical protein